LRPWGKWLDQETAEGGEAGSGRRRTEDRSRDGIAMSVPLSGSLLRTTRGSDNRQVKTMERRRGNGPRRVNALKALSHSSTSKDGVPGTKSKIRGKNPGQKEGGLLCPGREIKNAMPGGKRFVSKMSLRK